MTTTRNAAYVLSAQVVLLLSGTIISLGLGRLLGPELYGRYGVVFAIATVMNILLVPGMMQAVSKFVAERKDKPEAGAVARAVLKKQLLTGAIIAAAYFFLAIPLSEALRDKSLLHLFQIITPMAIIYGVSAVYGGYLTGTGRFLEQSKQLILYSTSRLVLTFLLAYLFSLAGAIIALPVSAMIALAYNARVARLGLKSEAQPAARTAQAAATAEVYKFALPLTLFSVLITLFMNTDLLLVQALLNNPQATGYYTAASATARIPYFVLTALAALVLPAVAGKLMVSAKEAQGFVKETLRYVLILLLPATAVFAATAKPLMMLLYRSEYAQAAEPAAILAIGTAALTLAYLLATVINASGKTRATVAVAAAMLIISVLANLAVIPKYGLKGAALVVMSTSLVAVAVLAAVAYKKIGSFVSYRSLIKILASTAVIFAVANTVQLQNKFLLPAEYIFLGIAYLILLVLFREIKKEDIKKIKSLIPLGIKVNQA
ncbi:polysaccharide biosynthesis protein [Candidatus Woesearchaeota archaeon]|nr:polysaccharide biosynthesis protein [Candidatus Woesearchaeota archaeon]